MPRRISLSGSDWLFKAYYGEDWLWRDAHKPVTRDALSWLPGSVPGSVHHDLWSNGEIPDPYFERNSLLIEWIPDRTWLYKKTFFIPDYLRGSRIQLRFEGVDYEAQFFLNGERLGDQRGMFTPAMFEVGDVLHYDADNLIAIVIEPAPHEQPQVSRTSRVRTHKSRMTYWWDFCPRMIHVGIWDDVFLDATGPVRIEDVYVRPQLNAGFDRAEVAVSIQLDSAAAAASAAGHSVEVEIVLRLGEEIVAQDHISHSAVRGRSHLDAHLIVNHPDLWWPNGHGDQPLYHADVAVRLASAEATASDERTVRFGIRRVELAPNETSDPTARPYTFVVNGRKLFANGWNWVPLDVLYGVPRLHKLDHLLRLAERAHVNLLRVWGGGLIERESFYNRCDELGIMVWQEFIQSSSGIENNPSHSPEFIDLMVREAGQIIPRKRNHPSLVLWCGGNELSDAPEHPLDDSHPLLAALKATVDRLDPDRLWLPTSPTGRVFLNSLDNVQRDPTALHDVHGPWEYQGVTRHYELYNRSTSLLHSEFGVEGITNRKSLDATIAPEHQWPATRENAIWHHLGAWWNQQPSWRGVFGDVADIDTLRQATQMMQADGLRCAVEAARRRKYQNSGTLPWQFNEPYPMATCTSAVDYYGQPKPAYYAVAHAYEPVHVSAKFPTVAWEGRDHFEAEAWINNSHLTPLADASLRIQIAGLSGRVYEEWVESHACPANSAAPVASILFPLAQLDDEVFFLTLTLSRREGDALSRSRYTFTRAANLAPLLTVPPTELSVQKTQAGSHWTLAISNTGSSAALFLWLEDNRAVGAEGYPYFDRNHFCLLPDESHEVRIRWHDVSESDRSIRLRGWNTAVWEVK